MLPSDTVFKTGALKARSIFTLDGHLVWCGSMQRGLDGLCHLYFSFWPESLGHNAWVTHSKIGHAVANAPLGPYEFKGLALDGAGVSGAWDRDVTHNPTVICHDGLFHLYYMGNYGDGSYWSHRNNQRVGHAFAERPEGPWHRSEKPVLDIGVPGSWDCVMTSNPSVFQTADGRFLMVYKGVGSKGDAPFYGPVLHGVALSGTPGGPFVKQGSPIFVSEGVKFPCEDPFVFRREGRFYAFAEGHGRQLLVMREGAGPLRVSRRPLLASA